MLADRSSSMEQRVFTDLSGAMCNFQLPMSQQVYSPFSFKFFLCFYFPGRKGSSGKADGTKEEKEFPDTGAEAENNSGNDQDGGDERENMTGNGLCWSEMDRYCIIFEDWVRRNQESKSVIKLPRPASEPRARKDKVSGA
jgi:hypothetical protein